MLKIIATRCFCTSQRQLITPFIQLAEPGTVGIITLNRPKEINAITHEMSEYVRLAKIRSESFTFLSGFVLIF